MNTIIAPSNNLHNDIKCDNSPSEDEAVRFHHVVCYLPSKIIFTSLHSFIHSFLGGEEVNNHKKQPN